MKRCQKAGGRKVCLLRASPSRFVQSLSIANTGSKSNPPGTIAIVLMMSTRNKEGIIVRRATDRFLQDNRIICLGRADRRSPPNRLLDSPRPFPFCHDSPGGLRGRSEFVEITTTIGPPFIGVLVSPHTVWHGRHSTLRGNKPCLVCRRHLLNRSF